MQGSIMRLENSWMYLKNIYTKYLALYGHHCVCMCVFVKLKSILSKPKHLQSVWEDVIH